MDDDMKEALKNVGANNKKDKIFLEVLNLRAFVARLQTRVTELETAAFNNG